MLRLREDERSQRLKAAAATASMLHLQTQHIRGMAAAQAAAAVATAAAAEVSPAGSCGQRGPQSMQGSPPASVRQHWSQSGSASAVRSSGGSKDVVSQDGTQGGMAMRLLLPSSGAAAAAAIAASSHGGTNDSRLPSRAARAEVRE